MMLMVFQLVVEDNITIIGIEWKNNNYTLTTTIIMTFKHN